MTAKLSFFAELKRRNVLRAGAIYAAAVWALAQGIAQLTPVVGAPEWVARWFLVAAGIGFPFWIVFAWLYEITPGGLKRESEIAPSDSAAQAIGRKLDFWIIGILAVVVVLLLTDRFVVHKNSASVVDVISATARIPQKSIAVLPLANDSGDKDQQYFSDGLSEDFINALSQFAGLKVIGRNSAFQFRNTNDDAKTIGKKLGVAHLLEGSVRRAGDTVRISAELINAADGSTLWSQHYDRSYKDLFALQDDITHAVASALQAKLLNTGNSVTQSDRPPSGNLAAYTAYLQGNFYYERGSEADFRKAIEQYNLAIQHDPRYALAYTMLSGTWTGLSVEFLNGSDAQDAFNKARAAANTALSLEPQLAAAHVARGYVLLKADFDWAGAEAEYRRAVQLSPKDGSSVFNLGSLEATLGKPESAVEMAQQALKSDPLRAGWYNGLADFLSGSGRLDDAASASRQAIALQPDADSYHARLTIIKILRGNAAAALAAAKQEQPGPWQDIALALARQIGPDPAAADSALKTLIDKRAKGAPYQIAEVYALRKDPDQMFAWLQRAWASRDSGIGYLLYDPIILRYQQDPRFAAFCKQVSLPTTTMAKAMP